jgi:hypothetical protein
MPNMKIAVSVLIFLCLFVWNYTVEGQSPKKHKQELKRKSNDVNVKTRKENKKEDFFAEFEKPSKILNEEKFAKVEINAKDGIGMVEVSNDSGCPKCPVNSQQSKFALQNFWLQRIDTAFACACQALAAGASDDLLKALLVSLKSQQQHIKHFPATFPVPTLSDSKPVLRDWEIFGPFPVGKMEIDGDPTFQSLKFHEFPDFASYLLAMSPNTVRYSELMTEGKVVWKRQQANMNGQVDVHFQAQWNELGQGLSNTAVYEYQGWARTTAYVKVAGTYVLDCQGNSCYSFSAYKG